MRNAYLEPGEKSKAKKPLGGLLVRQAADAQLDFF
jgi:hypothetical protein